MVKLQLLLSRFLFLAVPVMFFLVMASQSFSSGNVDKNDDDEGNYVSKLTVDQRICIFQSLASDNSLAADLDNCRNQKQNLKCVKHIHQLSVCFD